MSQDQHGDTLQRRLRRLYARFFFGAKTCINKPSHHTRQSSQTSRTNQDQRRAERPLEELRKLEETVHGGTTDENVVGFTYPAARCGNDPEHGDHGDPQAVDEGRQERHDQGQCKPAGACMGEREPQHLRPALQAPDDCFNPEPHDDGGDDEQKNCVDPAHVGADCG